MTDYAKLARQLYEDTTHPLDQVQTAALIAIAEALQPRPKPKPEPPATINIEGNYDPASLRAGVQAVLDHDPRHRAQRELDELREVVKGADHTAAKYWRRAQQAEQQRNIAESRMHAAEGRAGRLGEDLDDVCAALGVPEGKNNREGLLEAIQQIRTNAAEMRAKSLRAAHEHWGPLGPCPTCEGPIRETVVCQTCGRDYANADPT